jgi:pantoate--beta-alanine ligase
MQKKLKVHTLQKALKKEKQSGKTIGFVPTMGALHDGHISLINASNQKADLTVCSIFVNPTQFNDQGDLKKYPRTLPADAKLLRKAGCDYLFFPKVSAIYPKDLDTAVFVDLKGLDTKMEGAFRPGHFDGVVEVVNRLLNIVEPDYLFMGQKDFQQFTIIQHMLNELNSPTELVVCPILREPHGLAMSSRNERLTSEIRKKAAIIFQTLSELYEKSKTLTVPELIAYAMNKMEIPGIRPEYVDIIDGKTLTSISNISEHDYVVACTAVWAGKIRLIDNVIIKKESQVK